MSKILLVLTPFIFIFLSICSACDAAPFEISSQPSAKPSGLTLAGPHGTADIVVDPSDYAVVTVAANLLCDDVERVSGQRPLVRATLAYDDPMIIAGTLGHSALIDHLAQSGRLQDLDSVRNRWETTSWQIVDHPFPGVRRAFVIVGSDRRGTAYGLMTLSERMGVSPWYWWADVPPRHQSMLSISTAGVEIQSPSVKYRGIFINDEDAGLNPWAAKTFDPQFGNIGPKTYQKVFELMLRLKLNLLWPAMHPCSTEFASVPENASLADQYGIVMGASHTEAMLQNNVWWPRDKGPWNYAVNRDNIKAYWQESAQARGQYEAVWTLGIRGIHDSPMEGPKDMAARVMLVEQAITDQRSLLTTYVGSQWGPVAQCFVPYKEVQPIYDAGLDVPPDVTLVWADDNFGYIRRLSTPSEQLRRGGSGIYYHLSYLGGPHAYTWINTTPPALVWEELHKGWDNGARTLWMLNVGDIKPAELGIDYYAHLAWNAPSEGPDSQPLFLDAFAQRTFGPSHADEIATFLSEYYRLGQIRKPELMDQRWAAGLSPLHAVNLSGEYQNLLNREQLLFSQMPPQLKDAWTEIAGYPARMLAATGLAFLGDRLARAGLPTGEMKSAGDWHTYIDNETSGYNNSVASGKWRYMMTAGDFAGPAAGLEAIPWPWLPAQATKTVAAITPATDPTESETTVPASSYTRKQDSNGEHWAMVAGLGHSGTAMCLEPETVSNIPISLADAPSLTYDVVTSTPTSEIKIDLLPTFRVYPGLKLRLAVTLDSGQPQILEVPGSSGAEDENGKVRRNAVRDNRVTLPVPLGQLAAGKHTLTIQPMDPGVVIDEITMDGV